MDKIQDRQTVKLKRVGCAQEIILQNARTCDGSGHLTEIFSVVNELQFVFFNETCGQLDELTLVYAVKS